MTRKDGTISTIRVIEHSAGYGLVKRHWARSCWVGIKSTSLCLTCPCHERETLGVLRSKNRVSRYEKSQALEGNTNTETPSISQFSYISDTGFSLVFMSRMIILTWLQMRQ